MSKTLVAVFDGQPGHLLLQQRDIPHPRGGEILVRIEGCTLCGSDLHSLSGRRAVIVPTVLGHEMVGTIESFGPDASRVDRDGRPMAVGDRIVWAIVAECGECYYCLNELPQKCLHAVKYGHEMLCSDRGLVGGLAEHCLLVPKTSIVRLPSSLPTAVACPAGCATSTVTAAMEAAGEINGRTIVVLGAGLLGLTACAMARSLDASQILSIDLDVPRRERAFQFGANAAGGPADLADLVKERTEGRGADIIMDFTGSTRALETAWPTARIGGRFILVGAVFPDLPFALNLEQVVRRQITIRGVHNYAPSHLSKAVHFLETEHTNFPFADLVSAWYPLESVSEACQAAHNPQAIRIGIRP